MTWTKFTPIGSKILVRLHGKRTHHGLIEVPDDYRKQQESGEVIAVGPRAPRELEIGQLIFTGKYNGKSIEPPEHDPHGEYRVLEADHSKPMPHCPDVYAILENDRDESVETALLRVGTDVSRLVLP